MTAFRPEVILHDILHHPLEERKNYTYIILGDRPATGKTWLTNELRAHGYKAFEISERVNDLVTYNDRYMYTRENYVRIDHEQSMVVIVLNRPLKRNA